MWKRWEERGRGSDSLVLAREAQDPCSAEAEHQRMLEATFEELARQWL